jgi:hypothetical protein
MAKKGTRAVVVGLYTASCLSCIRVWTVFLQWFSRRGYAVARIDGGFRIWCGFCELDTAGILLLLLKMEVMYVYIWPRARALEDEISSGDGISCIEYNQNYFSATRRVLSRRRIPNTPLIIVVLPHVGWRHDGHVVSGYVWQNRLPAGNDKTGKTTWRCWTSVFKPRVAGCRHDVMAWFITRAGTGRCDVECSYTLLTQIMKEASLQTGIWTQNLATRLQRSVTGLLLSPSSSFTNLFSSSYFYHSSTFPNKDECVGVAVCI